MFQKSLFADWRRKNILEPVTRFRLDPRMRRETTADGNNWGQFFYTGFGQEESLAEAAR